MDWKDWSKVSFVNRAYLPTTSGIYIIVDAKDVVWYVGQAQDIRKRWAGKGHHRYQQLLRTNKKRNYSIYWKAFPAEELASWENHYISKLSPELNRSKVKRYIPSEPVKIREARRIVKVLSKLNQWYPKVRSILIGKYISIDSVDKIFFVFRSLDIGIITRSTWSKKSLIRKSWTLIRPTCGFDEETHQAPFIYTFLLQEGLEIVFLNIDELPELLESNLDFHDLYVHDIDFLGVKIKSLNSMDIFDRHEFSKVSRSYKIYSAEGTSYKLINRSNLNDFAYLSLFLKDIEPISIFEL